MKIIESVRSIITTTAEAARLEHKHTAQHKYNSSQWLINGLARSPSSSSTIYDPKWVEWGDGRYEKDRETIERRAKKKRDRKERRGEKRRKGGNGKLICD